MNAKDEEIYIKLNGEVKEVKAVFIHRQSHMPMFELKCSKLKTAYTLGKNQKYLEGSL